MGYMCMHSKSRGQAVRTAARRSGGPFVGFSGGPDRRSGGPAVRGQSALDSRLSREPSQMAAHGCMLMHTDADRRIWGVFSLVCIMRV